MKSIPRTIPGAAASGVLLLAALIMASGELAAQDKPEKDIISTDGLVQYGDADKMWDSIGSQWDSLSAKAVNRWDKVEPEKLIDSSGDREQLVDIVAEAYDIGPVVAQKEVDAWALSLNATE